MGLSPRAISARGVAMSFIPEDRLGMGLAPSMSVTDNMMLKNYQDHGYGIKPLPLSDEDTPNRPRKRTRATALRSF